MSQNFSLPLTYSEQKGLKSAKIVRAAVRIAVIDKTQSPPRILYVKHPVKGWELPGGAVDPAEEAHFSGLRELEEEAGLTVQNAQASFAGTIPVTDQNQAYWLDLIYALVIERAEQLNFSAEKEFTIGWFDINAPEAKSDRKHAILTNQLAPFLV